MRRHVHASVRECRRAKKAQLRVWPRGVVASSKTSRRNKLEVATDFLIKAEPSEKGFACVGHCVFVRVAFTDLLGQGYR